MSAMIFYIGFIIICEIVSLMVFRKVVAKPPGHARWFGWLPLLPVERYKLQRCAVLTFAGLFGLVAGTLLLDRI
jgi:hypothetical protein